MASATSFSSLSNKEQDGDEWNVVIKVKYGDTLRRFNSYVHQRLMIIGYDMNKLRAKISSLFNFSNDAVLVLTYTDEDGDDVALDNDDELRDAVLSQRLNPLRITVQPKPYSADGSYSRPETVRTDNNSGIKSDTSQSKFPELATELNSSFEKSLKSVPEPIRGVLKNISRDLIQATSSAPVLSELLRLFSKMQPTNASQSSPKPISKPVGTSCACPSATGLNTGGDEPKISNDQQIQLPRVLPQTNIVSPVPENLKKMHEIGLLSQCSGSINYAPVKFDQNISDEQKDNREVHLDGKSVFTTGPNSTLGSVDKPNPYVASMFFHGNCLSDSNNQLPVDATFSFPPQCGSTSQGVGNRHPASTAIPCTNTRPSDVTSGFPLNPTFSFAPKACSSSQGDVLGNMHGSPMLHPYRRSSSCHGPTSRIFHRGVICDGCGMHPIIGPRYKSTVKENYDLCDVCFVAIGKETEYTRIDWSAFRFPKAKKDFHKHKCRSRLLSTIDIINRVKVPRPKLESCFIRDVTIWDGTAMLRSSRFTKIWRMRNNGTIVWPSGTQLVWVRGDHLGRHDSVKLEIPEIGFPVDEELDVAVDFVAPSVLGQYVSYWQMASPSGQIFGEEVWVIIQVDDELLASSASDTPAFFNLNLPPESSQQSGLVAVDANAEPDGNELLDELLKPMTSDMLNSTMPLVLQPSSDGLDSPFIEVPESGMLNSVEKDGTSAPQPSSESLGSFIEVPASSSAILYPAIDVPQSLHPVSYPLIDMPPDTTNISPSDALIEENLVEETLLRELEEMGFKEIDLNKEILRLNQYDLEQSVEDLCDFREWDPLLKDLQEMGFNDRELNKKLLSKNGGSIKRVVMELITGEKGK